MKFYFSLGMALIVLLISGLLGYGVYLNQRGEQQISLRMENMRAPLTGERAKVRMMQPLWDIEMVNLYAKEMTDAVALENGLITAAFVEKNSHVRPGDMLFALRSEDIPLKIRQADSDILEAEAQFLKAENSYRRYGQLMEYDAISAEKYDEAVALYKAARARLENCRAQREQLELRQQRLMVTSPLEGEVLMLYHRPGSYVTAGTAVALIGDFRRLEFTAPVPDRITAHMSIGRPIDLTFAGEEVVQKSYGANYGDGNKGTSQVFEARIVKISPPPDEPAAVRQLVWEVDNSVGLLEPGIHARGQLHSRYRWECLTVPLKSVIDKSEEQVAVLGADGTLELRKVVTGARDDAYVEILSGLEEGDVVITSEIKGMKEGTPIEVQLKEES